MAYNSSTMKRRSKICRYSWICSGVGILVMIVGFFNGPLLPYQDPTPELFNKFNEQVFRSRIIMNCGFVLTGLGLLLISITRIIRKHVKD